MSETTVQSLYERSAVPRKERNHSVAVPKAAGGDNSESGTLYSVATTTSGKRTRKLARHARVAGKEAEEGEGGEHGRAKGGSRTKRFGQVYFGGRLDGLKDKKRYRWPLAISKHKIRKKRRRGGTGKKEGKPLSAVYVTGGG